MCSDSAWYALVPAPAGNRPRLKLRFVLAAA